MRTVDPRDERLGLAGTLIAVLLGAFACSATLFIIGFLFDSQLFTDLAKIGAVVGGALVFSNR